MRKDFIVFLIIGCQISGNALAQNKCEPHTHHAPSGDAPSQIIMLDPTTGRPTSDSSKAPQQALSAAEMARYNQAFDDLEVVAHPDGSQSVDISGLPQTPLAAEIIDGEVITCHVVDVPEATH